MSEIFVEIAERTKSKEFINALRRAVLKFPEASMEYNIQYFIDSAKEYIE